MISRMAFFEALIHNQSMGRSGRSFTCHMPRSAMAALLRYVYGGAAVFTASDALYLMSPEHGVSFYFASNSESSSDVQCIMEAAQLALSQMDIREAVGALLKAQELGNVQAEAVLVDVIADHYVQVEDLLDVVAHEHGDRVLLGIQRQIIRSLLLRGPSNAEDTNKTQTFDV